MGLVAMYTPFNILSGPALLVNGKHTDFHVHMQSSFVDEEETTHFTLLIMCTPLRQQYSATFNPLPHVDCGLIPNGAFKRIRRNLLCVEDENYKVDSEMKWTLKILKNLVIRKYTERAKLPVTIKENVLLLGLMKYVRLEISIVR
ncbi:hypothetical protein Tco_0781777 [Tanacetum coccineum]